MFYRTTRRNEETERNIAAAILCRPDVSDLHQEMLRVGTDFCNR